MSAPMKVPFYNITCPDCKRHFLGGIIHNTKRYDVYYCKISARDKRNILFYYESAAEDRRQPIHTGHIGGMIIGEPYDFGGEYEGLNILGEKLFLVYLGDKLNEI